MKICKVESHELGNDYVTVYYRVNMENDTIKAYRRFKRFVLANTNDNTYSHTNKEMLCIDGDGFSVHTTKSKNYIHMVIATKKLLITMFIEAMKAFDVIQTNKQHNM